MLRDPLTVRTVPGAFGAAEIEGVQAEDAADDAKREIVRNAPWEHGVICLRLPRRFWRYMIDGPRPVGATR